MADTSAAAVLVNEELARLRAELARARKWELLPGMIAMSLIAIMGFAIVCLLLIPMPMTDAAGTLTVTLITAVATNVGVIVGFFYGSSKDSKEKDATNRDQASTIATMAVTAPINGAAKPPVVAAQENNTKATLDNTAALNELTEETAVWNAAVALNTPGAFDGYLQKYPTGAHAADAKARSDALKNP